MRILFVCLALPFPPDKGQRLRNWSLLRALAAEGHEVSIISFRDPDCPVSTPEELAGLCTRVDVVPLPAGAAGNGPNYWQRAKNLASRTPYGVERYRSPAMTEEVQKRLSGGAFHLVLCDDIYVVANLPRPLPLPVLLNKHDLTHVIVRRFMQYERNPFRMAYGWLEYWKLRRWEALTASSSDLVLTCSELDSRLLRSICPGGRFEVVPNAIDIDDYVPANKEEPQTLLYVGAMDWYPNEDAVKFFVGSILPHLRPLAPAVRFVVTGRNPSARLRSQCEVEGVEFTGWVADIRALIAAATVCIVPLRIGSGTRLKILEAAALAKPIVSTTLGAEGLEFVDGSEILIADEPAAFARAVADLLTDAPRRRRIGAAARRRVEQCYSVSVLRPALSRALAGCHDGTARPESRLGPASAISGDRR